MWLEHVLLVELQALLTPWIRNVCLRTSAPVAAAFAAASPMSVTPSTAGHVGVNALVGPRLKRRGSGGVHRVRVEPALGRRRNGPAHLQLPAGRGASAAGQAAPSSDGGRGARGGGGSWWVGRVGPSGGGWRAAAGAGDCVMQAKDKYV